MKPARQPLVVTNRWEPAEDVVTLVLSSPDGAALPDWTPGAHIDLELANGLVRQYSLCGDPLDRAHWQIAVLCEAQSRGGGIAVQNDLTIGATVLAGEPRQTFPLQPAPEYLFIAGGIGITPILPMIRQAVLHGATWQLVYGGRRRVSMAFVPDLEALAERSAGRGHLRLFPQDETGLIPLADVMSPFRSAEPGAVYCCGPSPLLEAVEKACATFPADTLRVERFSPAERPSDATDLAFVVEISSTATQLTVPADRSVLEVLEDAGIGILSSCREGTCGTCETSVLEGEIDHRDSLLTADERLTNDTMFVCVSRAVSERLVLDL